ncbi:MAG: nucleoside deaminase [Paracoccaceae bacterium]
MDRALEEARAAARRGETPVGAVLTDPSGTVLAANGNRVRELSDPTAHAEILVLRSGAHVFGSERLIGCGLWVTLEPCPMCAGAIAHARVANLWYGATDPKGGGVDHGPRVFSHPTCHHRPEIFGSIQEDESARILRMFFRSLRHDARKSRIEGAG